jgi:hypothetical protein
MVGKRDDRIRSRFVLPIIQECGALIQGLEDLGTTRFEFSCTVEMQEKAAIFRTYDVTHAIIPRVHVPTVIRGKIKRNGEEIVEAVPISYG